MIGDLCRDVLDLHRRASSAGVADPQKLAKWMVKFAFEDQDFFEVDPGRPGGLGAGNVPVRVGRVAVLSGGVQEAKDRLPGMMLLIAMAISVAYLASWLPRSTGSTWTSGRSWAQ